MPNGVSDILSLLMGNMAPVDPRAQLLGQGINAGVLPGRDLISNLNTALDFASPSASMDFVERAGGPSALGAATGLPENDVMSVIRQSLGLEVSPVLAASHQTDLFKILPQLLTAQANVSEAETKKGELKVKEGELGVKDREAKVKEDAEKRLREMFEQGTMDEKVKMYDTNLKEIVLSGKTLLGEPVSKEVRQNAYRMLMGMRSNPNLGALITQLAQKGEWGAAGELVGMDPGGIQSTWWGGVQIQPGQAEKVRGGMTGGPLFDTGGGEGQVDPDVMKMFEEFQQGYNGLLDSLGGGAPAPAKPNPENEAPSPPKEGGGVPPEVSQLLNNQGLSQVQQPDLLRFVLQLIQAAGSSASPKAG